MSYHKTCILNFRKERKTMLNHKNFNGYDTEQKTELSCFGCIYCEKLHYHHYCNMFNETQIEDYGNDCAEFTDKNTIFNS